MEQPLGLARPSLESISPPEVSSQCERNNVEGDPVAANMTSTLQPIASTPEHSKNDGPQVMEGIGKVVNMIAGCCCGPSPLRLAEPPREHQALSQATCGCTMGKPQKCNENIVNATDCCMVEIKETLASQAMTKGGNILDPDG